MIYHLGKWEINSAESKIVNLLTNEQFHISPKAVEVLRCFITEQNRVFSIEQLIEMAWKGRVVSDHAVYRVIADLRKILNANDKNAYIVNIPKKGYKLNENIEVQQAPNTSQNKHLITKKLAFNFKKIVWGICSLGIIVLTVFYYSSFSINTDHPPFYQHIEAFTTAIGNETDPAISNDGKFLIYSKMANSSSSNLLLVDLQEKKEIQLTFNDSIKENITLSNHASHIAFVRRQSNHCEVVLLEANDRQTYSEKILFHCDWQDVDLELSKDGKTLYYTMVSHPRKQHSIYSHQIETGKTIQITTIKDFNSQGDRKIALSPDNTKLAFLRDKNWNKTILCMLDLSSFTEQELVTTKGWLHSIAWTKDSNHVIYQDSSRSLSAYSVNSKVTKKISSVFTKDIQAFAFNNLTQDIYISLGSNRNSIQAIVNPSFGTHVITPLGQMPTTLTQSTETVFFPNFANKSYRLAFMSRKTGSEQIWIRETSGAEHILTNYVDRRSARIMRWSPNDEFILTENDSEILYIDIKTKKQTILVTSEQYGEIGAATWAPDGLGIYFVSDATGDSQIYYKALDITTQPKQITKTGAVIAFATPQDKKLIIFKKHKTGLWEFNLETQQENLLIEDILNQMYHTINVTNKGIYYMRVNGPIMFYSFTSAQSAQVVSGPQIPALSISFDDKIFAYPEYIKTESSIYRLSQE